MKKPIGTAARRIAIAIRRVVMPATVVFIILILAFNLYDDSTGVQAVRQRYGYIGGKAGIFHDQIRAGAAEDILNTVPDVISIYLGVTAQPAQ